MEHSGTSTPTGHTKKEVPTEAHGAWNYVWNEFEDEIIMTYLLIVTLGACFNFPENCEANSLCVVAYRYMRILCVSKLLWVKSHLK